MMKIRIGLLGTGILIWMFLVFGNEPVHGDPVGIGMQREGKAGKGERGKGGKGESGKADQDGQDGQDVYSLRV